jgi:hypothetical protein
MAIPHPKWTYAQGPSPETIEQKRQMAAAFRNSQAVNGMARNRRAGTEGRPRHFAPEPHPRKIAIAFGYLFGYLR